MMSGPTPARCSGRSGGHRVACDFGSRRKLTTSPPGISPQGGVTFDPLHAIDVENIDRTPLVHFQVFVTGHLGTDEPVVIGVAGEINAVAVRDGERGSFRNTLSSDVVSEPIEAKTRHNDAAHAAIVAVERQRKLNDFPAGRQTFREFSDREFTGL